MDWGSAPDWLSFAANATTAGVALYAAAVGLKTFNSQRTSTDVSLSLTIFAEINRYWDQLSKDASDYDYNMGQILAQFEIASGLFNRGVLTNQATLILGDHIVEVFTQLRASSDGQDLIDRCCSSDTTFEELKRFAASRMPQALNVAQFRAAREDGQVGPA